MTGERSPASFVIGGGTALALAMVFGAGCRPTPTPQPPAVEPPGDRPNVVLIVFDTTRADRCSVNGYGRPTTPTLEALAAEGARFLDCWSPSPWTPPSHASLFTGLRPEHHGLRGGRTRFHLAPASETLAEQLRDAGYATACFTENEFVTPAFGLTQGFDLHWGVWEETDVTYPGSVVAHRRAADWALDRHAEDKPFFVFVNDLEPHNPYEPTEPHRSRFLSDGATAKETAAADAFRFPRTLEYHLGLRQEADRTLELVSDLYDAEIAMLDATLAPLVARFREAGVLEETLFIVTSDHGENLGERGMAEHMFSANRTLLHVPLVIRYPRAFAPGTVVDDVVRLEDLFPTILELCGVDVPPDLDGASLLRDLPGRLARADYAGQKAPLDTAMEEFPMMDLVPFRASMSSVFDGRYHLIRRSDGIDQLYDVSADPLELTDLAASEPGIVERLGRLLERQ